MRHTTSSSVPTPATTATATVAVAAPGLGLLIRLKLTLLRNRIRQLVDQSPLKLVLVAIFMTTIWCSLYFVFDIVFRHMRKWEHQSSVAIPYVFHIFFVAMSFLLAFSTAVLIYGALFGRAEPSFLLAAPNRCRSVVAVMFLEAMFFASWSLVLLGMPLMLAIGQAQDHGFRFYITFLLTFLAFVPIPSVLGMCVAWAVAMWIPRSAKKATFLVGGVSLLAAVFWWGRLWIGRSDDAAEWLRRFTTEMEILRPALLPSTWVTNAIKYSMEGNTADALFYLGVTLSTAMFFSWVAVNIVGRGLMTAFGRAHAIPTRASVSNGRASRWLTDVLFFYRPAKVRALILKDVRTFLRDPIQWAQLVILFGLLSLYLAYLPRTRPDGFSLQWKALICFLNYGAITLILSTFTSRFVFPMISIEGRQMWLVGLWPLSRTKVMWAKFDFALTITAFAALGVTWLSIRALDLPLTIAMIQAGGTLSACVGLCGLAVGLGALIPSYQEANTGRIASGLGGTVNLIASIGLVALTVAIMGLICSHMAGTEELDRLDRTVLLLCAAQIALGLGVAIAAMQVGKRSFKTAEF